MAKHCRYHCSSLVVKNLSKLREIIIAEGNIKLQLNEWACSFWSWLAWWLFHLPWVTVHVYFCSQKPLEVFSSLRKVSRKHTGLLLLFLFTLKGLCLCKFSSVQCCCTSKETLTRTIRDKEPSTANSTFTQLLSCVYIYIFIVCFWGLLPWEIWYTFPGDGPLHMHWFTLPLFIIHAAPWQFIPV